MWLAFPFTFSPSEEGGPRHESIYYIPYTSMRSAELLISNAHFLLVWRGFAENQRLFKRSVFIYGLHKFILFTSFRGDFLPASQLAFWLNAFVVFLRWLLTVRQPKSAMSLFWYRLLVLFGTGSKLNFKWHLFITIWGAMQDSAFFNGIRWNR